MAEEKKNGANTQKIELDMVNRVTKEKSFIYLFVGSKRFTKKKHFQW